MVGASGGVYGLLLAFGVYFPHRRVLLLFPPIPLPARVFVAGFAVLELFFGVTALRPASRTSLTSAACWAAG